MNCYLCDRAGRNYHCQDCGKWYCDACFHTPCHDLCAEEIGWCHWKDQASCPHLRDELEDRIG